MRQVNPSALAHGPTANELNLTNYNHLLQIFVICSGTLFLPLLLESYSRKQGRLSPDYTHDCPASYHQPLPDDLQAPELRCAVHLLGFWVDTASFSLFVYSVSVALQALVVISMGSLADSPRLRHTLLTSFAAIGSVACVGFIFLTNKSPVWWVCGVLALVANVTYGASMPCLNAYRASFASPPPTRPLVPTRLIALLPLAVPDLGHSDPIVLDKLDLLHDARERVKAAKLVGSSVEEREEASRAYATAAEDYSTARALATSRISSTAIASGYAAGISALALLVIPVTLMGGTLFSLRLAICGSGLAWGLGTIREIAEPGLLGTQGLKLDTDLTVCFCATQLLPSGCDRLRRLGWQWAMGRLSLVRA